MWSRSQQSEITNICKVSELFIQCFGCEFLFSSTHYYLPAITNWKLRKGKAWLGFWKKLSSYSLDSSGIVGSNRSDSITSWVITVCVIKGETEMIFHLNNVWCYYVPITIFGITQRMLVDACLSQPIFQHVDSGLVGRNSRRIYFLWNPKRLMLASITWLLW